LNPAGREVIQKFEKLYNFRDIGGLKTEDGNIMKSGLLFRSDELSRMTEKDIEVFSRLQIKVICDLRDPNERQSKPSPFSIKERMEIVHIPLHDHETKDASHRKLFGFLFGKNGGDDFKAFNRGYYHHMAFERCSKVKEIITLLSQQDNLPALIHCTAGKDRTGYISALIQLLVGVPYETVVEDYLMTNSYYEPRLIKFIKLMRWLTLFQVSPERMKLILMADREALDAVYDHVIRKYGLIEAYLCQACEIEQSTIMRIKNLLLQ
jgi:protein-tyrosine phosphatase